MRAMVLFEPKSLLQETVLPNPQPTTGEILLRVEACGVCRADLYTVDGDLPTPKLPLMVSAIKYSHVFPERQSPPFQGGVAARSRKWPRSSDAQSGRLVRECTPRAPAF